MMELALFPLRSVLFPGGLLPLKVFEARYLDLMSLCLREQRPFGVVCITEGVEVGKQSLRFERAGTLAHVQDIDAEGTNVLRVQCRGGQRFEFTNEASQDAQGLWSASVELLPEDSHEAPDDSQADVVQALRQLAAQLDSQGQHPFATPYALDQAAWVSNRWCEVLPLPLPAKQQLLLLPDPQVRLKLIGDFLRSKSVL
jgi:uncharacterized protein